MSIVLREKKISNNRISLYLDIYENGERNFEFLKLYLDEEKRGDKTTKDKNKEIYELAKKIKAKREIEIASDVNGFISSSNKSLNFIEYFKKFSETKEPQTRLSYVSCLNYLIQFQGETLSFQKLDAKFIERFVEFLKNEKLKNSSISLYLSKLKAATKKAIRDGILIKSPFDKVEPLKSIHAKRDYLTLDEIRKLIETPVNESIKIPFLLACFTGLRLSDVEKLTWNEIQNDSISIYQKKTSEPLQFPMTEPAKQILNKIERTGEKVVNVPNRFTLNLKIKKWTLAAGINKNVSFHTARHSFAVNYLTLGGDVFVLKELLGHSLLETTMVYAEIINERKQQAVKLFPKIDF